MKPFMDADFLLQTDTAKTLYHEAAEKMHSTGVVCWQVR